MKIWDSVYIYKGILKNIHSVYYTESCKNLKKIALALWVQSFCWDCLDHHRLSSLVRFSYVYSFLDAINRMRFARWCLTHCKVARCSNCLSFGLVPISLCCLYKEAWGIFNLITGLWLMLMQLGVDIIFLMQKFPEIWKFLTNFQIHQKSAQNKNIPRKMKKEKIPPACYIFL